VNLIAQWARFGKRRDDTEDYRVLETSNDQLTASSYEQLIRRYLPGTPSHDAGDPQRPDALPWVWFGPAEEASLGLAVLDLGEPEDKDFVGRRTDPTRYFRLAWSQLASVQPSYADLARALRPVQLPAPNGEAVSFAVESIDPRGLADSVERLGFERIAVVAALLLEGPVALVNSERLTVEERLACLDVIAALLPYGLRADLAASTWADPTTRLRLHFGSRARPGQRPVEWSPPEVPPGPVDDPVAARYLRLLHLLQRRHGTGRLVEFLAAEASALRFDPPEQALERLEELDPPFIAWNEVHDGRGDPVAVRRALGAAQVQNLDAAELRELVDFLLSAGNPADLEAVERHWRPELLPRLSAAVAGVLGDEPDGVAKARPYLALAERQGGVDRLLTDMVAWQGAFDHGGRPSATQLSQQLDLLEPYLRAPAPDALPELRETLVRQPAVVYELLARARPQESVDWARAVLAWLTGDRQPPRELRPLLAVLDGDLVAEDELRALWQLGPRHVRTLLALIRGSGMLISILPAVWRWLPLLTETDELSPEERQAWSDAIVELATPGIETATQIRLDLLALLLNGRPIHGLDQVLIDDGDYLGRFHEVYWSPELAPVRPRLAALLVRYLAQLRWTQPAALADNVLGLLRTVADPAPSSDTPPDARHLELPPALLAEVLDLIADGIRRDAGVSELRQFQDWWSFLMKQSPRHAALARTAGEYQSIGQDNSIETVAASAAKVLLNMPEDPDAAIDTILRRLRTPPYFHDTEHFEVFLYLLRLELRRGGMDPARLLAVDRSIVNATVEGRLGPYLVGAYPRHLARFADELSRTAGLIEAIKGRLLPEELDRLRAAAQQFDDRMKQLRSRSGQKPRFLRRGDRS
jgi:hypothetical protein